MSVKSIKTDHDFNGDSRLFGNLTSINKQTGTTYTLQLTDCGKVVDLSNAGAITLNLPQSLPEGFNCLVVQSGNGQVTFAVNGGAVLRHRQNHAQLSGLWAAATLLVRANPGTAAEYVLQGDTA